MSMTRLDGMCIDIDVHTSNLLEIYTRAVNRWVEELAQNLLARALADEIERLGAWV